MNFNSEDESFVSYSFDEIYYVIYYDILKDPPHKAEIRKRNSGIITKTHESDDLIELVYYIHKYYYENLRDEKT